MRWKIFFDIKEYNGFPKIRILWGDEIICEKKFISQGEQILELETDDCLPNNFVIQHYGKNMKKDTLVEDNVIKKDKAVIIKELHINEIKLKNELYLFDFVKEDNSLLQKTNYIGFNGKFIIPIGNDNLNLWFFGLHSQLYKNDVFDYEKFKREIFSL